MIMDREKKINIESERAECSWTETCGYTLKRGDVKSIFNKGAAWADEHPKNPWVSVKDRLPEPEQEVFLYDRDSVKHYAVGWLRKKKGYCKSKWFVTNGYVTDESITHWAPIVEPK